jgi:enoyl-CoA hydratase/carnithine racemase
MTEPRVELAVMDRIATVRLDNPPVNAVSFRLIEQLNARFDEIEADTRIRCVILEGAGDKAFCAGADLRDEAQLRDKDVSREFRAAGRRMLERIESFRVPIVAALHGWCIGGGTALAWTCDIRIAADNTKFRAGDAFIGVIPSWGMGLLRLPRLVGRNRALDLLILGEDFDAARAYELGLVTRVVPRASLQAETLAVAQRIAGASPNAIKAIRQAVSFNMRRGWDEMAQEEEVLCAQVFGHPDAAEGMSAMLAKRAPTFQDN